MFLKRLEINGFKSFAGKTVFNFSDAGIVCIVGPNGSGKSNIIDAIRWLIGEREAKALRGEKIEDLIFAGTPKKPRQSLAKVNLVFDNSTGTLPVDFKEVIISRSINRGGVSQYFINDSEVRLKDIIDFFSKIRLGTRGLSVIGQGEGDIFVKASPWERMMMVQEILGLKEYHLKKNEAERKLKNTKINLEKVAAMVGEVAPRLRTLKKQTVRWAKRFEIEQELESLEENFFAFKIKNLLETGKKARQPLGEIENQIREIQKETEKAENNLEAVEATASAAKEIDKIQKIKKGLLSEKSSLEKELFRLEIELEKKEVAPDSLISLEEIKKLIDDVKEKLSRLLEERDPDALRKGIGAVIVAVDAVFSKNKKGDADESLIKSVDQKKKHLLSQVDALDKQLKKLDEEESYFSKNLEEFNSRFKEAFSCLESLRQKLQFLGKEKERVVFEEEKIAYRLDELKNQIHSFGRHFKTFEDLALSETFNVSFSGEELEQSERKILKLRGELASIGEIDQSLVKEAEEVEAHHNFLVKESKDLSLAVENLAILIKELGDKISGEFRSSFSRVNEEFHKFFRIMFGGGQAKMKIISKEKVIAGVNPEDEKEIPEVSQEDNGEEEIGIDIDLSIPQKKINSLEMLSGGEKSLVSLAVLFALISVSPPPFLVLDEADSALDEKNSRRFSELVKTFAKNSQFVIVTHNRVTMEAADALYGVTMDDTGSSKILSLRLEDKVVSDYARTGK
ncbi:MAG: Chromosome partition protein Smc [Candidatus Wolfebacteria bacterium GW2011_GWC1_43_10]|uniref:Chromosome partition protein Smc n=1 Tax=Candidatus Wolfebacteria bacterium GW2011_GWC1_43_10 TaxID=1619011 RepID=A0A0G1CBE6_9BACT|nr:MAG: Chromosome partition protein Smc [Candidatus Wolfebacteria bacterium GW2011_GWC1_43_10]